MPLKKLAKVVPGARCRIMWRGHDDKRKRLYAGVVEDPGGGGFRVIWTMNGVSNVCTFRPEEIYAPRRPAAMASGLGRAPGLGGGRSFKGGMSSGQRGGSR